MDGNVKSSTAHLANSKWNKYLAGDPVEKKPTMTEQLKIKEKESDINNVNIIIQSFVTNLVNDTKLRGIYAYVLFGLLAIQIIAINIMIFKWGFGEFKLEDSIFHWYLTLVVSEVIGFVYIVANYLFKPNDKFLEQMIKLLKNKE